MVTVTDFRTVVFDYLSLSTDRKVFTLRFAELLSGIEKYGDPPAIELGHALYSHLVLAIAGAITEDELRDRIAHEFTTVKVNWVLNEKEPSFRRSASADYSYAEPSYASY